MMRVKRYDAADKKLWDGFCGSSLNGVFLFRRNYMDYHSDRFRDHSLLFYNGNNSAGVRILSAHDGLTFGGFIMGERTHLKDMLECVDALLDYCKKENIAEVRFKPVPLLLRRVPSEQDVYALIRKGAEHLKSEPSTVTALKEYIPGYGEKYECNRAMRAGLSFRLCEEDAGWEQYHRLLTEVLRDRHGAKPVHSLPELLLLRGRFPENIKLFAVFDGEDMLAGTVIYEYDRAVHTQYMASNDAGRASGALHYCIQKVIEYYRDRDWLDFGISTEDGGKILNSGLIRFKEGFRGNVLLYDKWSLKII